MNTYSPLVTEVAAWFSDPKPNGSSIKVKCPNHQDDKQSLSVSLGEDGKVLLKCFAGCSTEDILARVGKSFTDLFERKREPEPKQQRRIVKTYDYVDEKGKMLFQSVRFEPKDFSQRQPNGYGGWTWNLQGVRRVLYHLDEIVDNPKGRVWITEGEKDTDRLRETFGVLATCNPMGAGKDKWSSELSALIENRSVVILPDNDEPGRLHAQAIAASLTEHGCKVRVLDLPGVPVKGDISDWIDLGGNADQLKALVDACPWWSPDDPNCAYVYISPIPLQEMPPFPVDVFPSVIRSFVEQGAAAINVPADMIAMPLLGFAAGVIGKRIALGVKSSWIERANLWIAVIGDPGSGKSPAISYARIGVDILQNKAKALYEEELARFTEQEKDKSSRAQLKQNNVLLSKPTLQHYFTTDSTTQAVSGMLRDSPGVVILREELVGWVQSHDAFNKTGDRANFLSLWTGSPLKVDRVSAETIFVAHPCVPVVGGIQPDMLPDLAEESNKRDGFVERILMTWPDSYPQQWTEADADPDTTREVIRIFSMLRVPEDQGRVIQMSREARKVFASWYNENGKLTTAATGIAAGCYSKYPGQLARIALVLHCLRHPGDTRKDVDESTVIDAIAVIEYLRCHLVRILPRFSAVGLDQSAALEVRVLRVLRNAGDWVARSELRRGLGNSVSANHLNETLVSLALEGKIENRTVPTGARPREESRIVGSGLGRSYVPTNVLEMEDDE